MDVTEGTALERARHARTALADRFSRRPWWRGAGLVPAPRGWMLRLDVTGDAPIADLPAQVEGVPVEVRAVGPVPLQPETD